MSDSAPWANLEARLKNILELKATLEALEYEVVLETDRLAEDTFYIQLNIYAPPMDIDQLVESARRAGLSILADELAALQPPPPPDSDEIPF